MIGKLTGTVDSYGEDFVILDVAGVGYVAHCSARTLQELPPVGARAILAIETYVREDVIRLYGFGSNDERDWFRLLQAVQGVGAKVALAILSVLDPAGLATALATGDRGAVAQAPGVGPKLASRIVAELKDRVPAFAATDAAVAGLGGGLETDPRPAIRDAVSALVNLGYADAQARVAVATASRSAGPESAAGSLIRLALRELAR